MGSLASHCYDVLKEQGAYDNSRKTDERHEISFKNSEKRAKVESGGTVPYYPDPEIIEHPDQNHGGVLNLYYLYPHEPDIEFFKGASDLHPLGDS